MNQISSYREVLNSELEERCRINPKYSLRAFARDLGISPSQTSEILTGRKGLSEKVAMRVAMVMGFNMSEADHFCDLVVAETGRSRKQRAEAKARLFERHIEKRKKNHLSEDRFKVISDWYHFAILELISVKGFNNDPVWISKRLGISAQEAKQSIERLIKIELVSEKDGKLIPTQEPIYTTDDVPSEAVKNCNRQLLEKAIQALKMQRVDEREISSVIVAVNRNDIDEVKRRIKQFKTELNLFLEERVGERHETYAIGMQFFRLTEKES